MEDNILKALCEPKRFLILKLLSEQTYCVRALAAKSCLTESAVSQHLKILKEAGLVTCRKRGYYTHYSVDNDALDAIISEFENLKHKPSSSCGKPFYGCDVSAQVGCGAYIPEQLRGENR